MDETTLRVIFNLSAVPFGFSAMYYGYRGYQATKGGLNAYKYYLIAMTGIGAGFLFDLLILIGLMPGHLAYLMEMAFLVATVFLMLAFKDIVDFFKSAF